MKSFCYKSHANCIRIVLIYCKVPSCVRYKESMSSVPVVCLLVLLCIQGLKAQSWSPIFEQTGPLSGHVGGLHTFEDGSNLGGYLHGDLSDPNLINGFGARGRYQGERWHVEGDANARFPHNRPPSFGLSANAGVDLTPRLSLGAHVNSRFGGGRSRPDIGGGLNLRYRFPRKRRSITCMSKCNMVCSESPENCLHKCIRHMC